MSNMFSIDFSVNTNVLPKGLAWYAKRLSVMGPGEIMHRVREGIAMQSLQLQYRLSKSATAQHYGPQDIPRHQFCGGFEQQLPKLPWQFDIDQQEIARLLRGTISALSHEWTWRPDAAVWHEAPDTKQAWPQIFFHRIPYREGNPYGDIRIAWEPSRLQHLVTLALYAQQAPPDGRRRAVELIETQLLSWVTANPPLTGIHYVSVMECALRLLAVCHTLDLVRPWLTQPEKIWAGLLNLVASHAELIRRRVSGHSSSGNHTIAEAAGLIYAGLLFPKMELAERWLAYGLYLLEQEAPHQIRQDGGGREEAIWYLRFISDLYGLVIELLRHHQQLSPQKLVQASERSHTFLHAMMRPGDGALPYVGDGDSGYALSPFLRFVPIPVESVPGLTSFHLSGFSILRGRNQERLLFDHGELGMAPCYAHGHADALSVQLEIGRQEILIDPGTFSYTGHPDWRQYFRSTRAHNTVTVDGRDQAVQETSFLWSQPFETHLIYRDETPEGKITVLARHYAYVQQCGVTHWRGVVYQPPGSWLVWDWLTGTGTHHLELNWNLGLSPVQSPTSYVLSCEGQPVQLSVEGGQASLHRGETDPPSGWRSSTYGSKEPVTTLRVEHRGTLPHEFLTRIWCGEGPPPAHLQTFSLSRDYHGSNAR